MMHIVFGAVLVLRAQQFAAVSLQDALQRATVWSPDVAQARERVNENAALLSAARAAAAPALIANYTASPQAGNNNQTVIQQLSTLGAQVTLGDYVSARPAIRQAEFTLASSQFDLLDAMRTERVKVIGQYFGALKAAATRDVRGDAVAGAQQDLRAAQLRYRAGDAPRLDVVRAQVALASAQADLDAANVDYQNAVDALATETGAAPSDFSRLSGGGVPPTRGFGVQESVRRALAQRSDLASAEQLVRAEQAAVAVSRRAVLPAVTISGGYTAGIDTGIPVHGPSANVTVTVPVSRAAQYRTVAETARLAQAQSKAAAIRRQIALDAAAAARTYAETVRALESARRARQAAEQQLRATQIGYRSGASSSLDVSDARRTFVQAALAEVTAMYAQAQALATLEQVTGQ